MKRRAKVYDPVAYQAELDAKCSKAGTNWLPQRHRGAGWMPDAQRDANIEARLTLARLALPIGEEWDAPAQVKSVEKDGRA